MGNMGFVISSSPHIRSNNNVQRIMLDVIIALIPSLAFAIYFFGINALLVTLTCVITCVVAEYICKKIMKQDNSIADLSAVVTGMLLAFNLPPAVPLWTAAIGAAFAIVIVKQLFGGIGQNIINPALAGRAFLLASWPTLMTTWTLDGVTGATPLGILKEGGGQMPSFWEAFVGHIGGCIGEVSSLALLLGFAYLLIRKVIKFHIPVVYIASVAIFTFIFGREGFLTGNGLYEIFLGGLFLGAIFMATDYTTTPMTIKGQVVFALGCGLLTTVIRIYGGYPEGVSYSILIMNLFVPLIDKFIVPRRYGMVKKA